MGNECAASHIPANGGYFRGDRERILEGMLLNSIKLQLIWGGKKKNPVTIFSEQNAVPGRGWVMTVTALFLILLYFVLFF